MSSETVGEENQPHGEGLESAINGDVNAETHQVATMSDDGRVAMTLTQQVDNNNNTDKPDEESIDNIRLTNLKSGFNLMREVRERNTDLVEVLKDPIGSPAFVNAVLVNFIDPTSYSGSLVAALTAAGKMGHLPGHKPPLELYEKFTTIFQRDFQSSLRQVSYEDFRGGASGVIDILPIRPVLSRSHGGLVSIGDDDDSVAWAGSGGESGDASEWHTLPFCYVYMVSCENLELYRNKVKPSIQAFVSQLESVTGNPKSPPKGKAADSSVKRSVAPRYMIVFVPTSPMTAAEEGSRMARVGSALSRMRQRAAVTREITIESAHSGGTSNTDGSDDLEASSDTGSALGISLANHQLSKLDKEVLRRLSSDFPNGNICTLSTLLDPVDPADADDNEQSQLQKLEWNAVLKALGIVIAEGFRDRCHRYDEELRKLDAQRGSKEKKTKETNRQAFNLMSFFLVKESFAFTCEQMRLAGEALLHYEELRAFMPDVKEIEGVSGEKGDENSIETNQLGSLSLSAVAGDPVAFRGAIRTIADMNSVAHLIEEYLFTRESTLLFKLNKPVEVLRRARNFAQLRFSFENAISLSSKSSLQRSIHAHRWAFQFCWDLLIAAKIYIDPGAHGHTMESAATDEFSRSLCDIVEFARIRFIQLGRFLFESNPLGLIRRRLLLDMKDESWPKYVQPHEAEAEVAEQDHLSDDTTAEAFLEDALSSPDAFQARFLTLTRILVGLNELSGRHRHATQLRLELVELLVQKGKHREALEIMNSVVDVFTSHSLWGSCALLARFRKASLERNISAPNDYLETLVNAFHERAFTSVPFQAIDSLQRDLEILVESPIVRGTRFSSAPTFEPRLGLEGLPFDRMMSSDRSLFKRVYSVGEKVRVLLTISSHLARPIDVDCVAVSVVPFRTYVAAMEDSTAVKEEDYFRVLQIEGAALLPGQNNYTFDWAPMASGQYILSSIIMSWKNVRFTYAAKEIDQATIRVDIVPRQPTQSIQVSPTFLLPGQEQNVRLILNTNSDIIVEGLIRLTGSPGITILSPATEHHTASWASFIEIPIMSCLPEGSIEYSCKVKTENSSEKTVDTLRVDVATIFKHMPILDHGRPLESNSIESQMRATLEAIIPALGSSALIVERVDQMQLSASQALVSTTVRCALPVPFTISGWSFEHEPFLEVVEVAAANDSLRDTFVVEGESICFCFACSWDESKESSTTNVVLKIKLTDDFGASFQELLHIRVKRSSQSALSPASSAKCEVAVVPSATEGLVGIPIKLSYSVKLRDLPELPIKLGYKISSSPGDWILGGQAEGQAEYKDHCCELSILVVPTRPGHSIPYPDLLLNLIQASGAMSPLVIRYQSTNGFDARGRESHVSTAFRNR